MTKFIIATCKLCGLAGSQVEPESLICKDCLYCRRREHAQVEMSEIADIAGGMVGFIQGQILDKKFQVKSLMYAAAAITNLNNLDKEEMKRFYNCCIYEFEDLEDGYKQTT